MRHPPSSRARGPRRTEPPNRSPAPKGDAPRAGDDNAPRVATAPLPVTKSEARGLPLVPAELEIDPILAALLQTTAFLDLSDDDVVNAEAARAILERVGLYVQRLDDDAVERVATSLDALLEYAERAGWPEEARDFVRDFLEHCGFVLDTDGDDAEEAPRS